MRRTPSRRGEVPALHTPRPGCSPLAHEEATSLHPAHLTLPSTESSPSGSHAHPGPTARSGPAQSLFSGSLTATREDERSE